MLREIKLVLTRWRRFWPYWLWALVALPVIMIRLRGRQRASGPLKILVMPQTNRLGDLACATPVFHAIKQAYPDAHLAVLVSRTKSAWQILEADPVVDEIIFYEDPRLVARLRQARFAWSVALTNYAVPSVLAFLARIPRRIKTTVRPRQMSERVSDWLNTDCRRYAHHTSLPRHYLRLLEPLGIKATDIRPVVTVGPAAVERVQSYWRARAVSPSDFIVGLSLTAGNKIKEWGDRKFGELARELARRYRATILFLGAPGDASRIRALLTELGPGPYYEATEFPLVELPALLNSLHLYIAVDTGPIYVAYGLGVPLVDIVGPVDPREQPPIDDKSLLIGPPTHMKPSSFVFHPPGRPWEHQRALAAITVAQVVREVDAFIKKLDLARPVSS